MRNRLPILIVLLAAAPAVLAGSLDITVNDGKGAPVANAVVFAVGPRAAGPAKKQAVIDQRDKQFVPYVTAVQTGTAIIFPNKDNIRHHVYSLSPAKKFELPLYEGVPAAPVVFDREGFVTLGCNIHDWMLAYVAVVPSPFFEVTGTNGRVRLSGLPAGPYTVKVWHPLLKGVPDRLAQKAEVDSGAKSLLFTLDLRADFRTQRGRGLSNGEYP